MQTKANHLLLSPTDLTGFLACEHLTRLEIQVARGEKKRPVFSDPYADLIRQKGKDHEAAFLAKLAVAPCSMSGQQRLEWGHGKQLKE